MKKNADNCTLEPEFPPQAFMLFLFILHQDKMLGLIPLDSIFLTPESAADGVTETVTQLQSNQNGITIPEECLLVPITRKSTYPLRKEFWTNPTVSYNSQVRMKTFSPVLDHPAFYSLLVTPYSFDDKTGLWYHHAALPIMGEGDTAAIERFMLTSDHVVEPRAKSAAIYSMGGKIRYNWQTKTIKPFDDASKKILQDFN